jgi:hypothetical protein
MQLCRASRPSLHVLVDVCGSEDHDKPDDRVETQSDNDLHGISLLFDWSARNGAPHGQPSKDKAAAPLGQQRRVLQWRAATADMVRLVAPNAKDRAEIS